MSHEPTMFWILKSVNLALKPSFWMIRAYLRLASLLSSSDLAPVTTILPEAKIKAVVLGSRTVETSVTCLPERWQGSDAYCA